ncbi:hypothetical protein [Bradyrhizobium sp. USDA 3650]
MKIDPHVAGKLADRGHEFAARGAGKVPIENVASKVEIFLLFVRGFIRRTHAVAAQPDRSVADTHVGLSLRLATEFTGSLDLLKRDLKSMAGQADGLLRRLEKGFGDGLWVRSANRFFLLLDLGDERGRFTV